MARTSIAAGLELGVLLARQARGDGPLDSDHVLVAELAGAVLQLGPGVGLEDDLGEAVAVAHVDEDEAPEVAPGVDPAVEHNGLPDMVLGQITARVSPFQKHDGFSREERRLAASPGVVIPGSHDTPCGRKPSRRRRFGQIAGGRVRPDWRTESSALPKKLLSSMCEDRRGWDVARSPHSTGRRRGLETRAERSRWGLTTGPDGDGGVWRPAPNGTRIPAPSATCYLRCTTERHPAAPDLAPIERTRNLPSMRFDPARVSRTIAELEGIDRREQDPGLSVKAYVAAGLASYGWVVQTRQVVLPNSARHRLRWLTYLGLGLGGTAAFLLLRQGTPNLWRMLPWVLAAAWWKLFDLLTPHIPWLMQPLTPVSLIIARRPVAASTAGRIVIQVLLDPVAQMFGTCSARTIDAALVCTAAPLIVTTLFDLPSGIPGTWKVSHLLALAFLIGVWGTILFALSRRVFRSQPDTGILDSAALAFLFELARTWPRGHFDSIETILAAVGGDGFDGIEGHATHGIIPEAGPDKPTFVLSILSPGVGKGVLVFGSGIARQAAQGLWVPHRLADLCGFPAVVHPVGRGGDAAVLAGEAWNQSPRTLDEQALGRTSQLVAEIALRWARLHESSGGHDPEDDRAAARSSQNPG